MLSVKQKGDFKKTNKFLKSSMRFDYLSILHKYGQEGVTALASATPTDSGLTAQSWTYEIIRDKSTTSLVWKNSNIRDGVPIAILIQYGHATRSGGYVQGRDYINPVIQPIFDRMAEEIRREVRRP